MPIYRDRDKDRWRFQFNRVIAGRRHRASRLLPAAWDRARAENYARQEEGHLYALAAGVERPRPLIAAAIALYLTHRVPQLRDRLNIARELNQVVPWLEGRSVEELGEVGRAYVAENAGLAPGTLRNRLSYLRAAVRYAWRRHQLGGLDDPAARLEIPSVNNARHVYLEPRQVAALARACDDRETRALIRIAFYTGLRWISEILPRQRADILKQGGQWWLRIADTKTGQPHMVAVHPAIRRDLGRLPFTRHWRDYYAHFERARKRAGFPHVVMHDLRHSHASALASSGATLPLIQRALGHKSIVATQRYAHLYPRAVAAMVKRIPTPGRGRAKKKAA